MVYTTRDGDRVKIDEVSPSIVPGFFYGHVEGTTKWLHLSYHGDHRLTPLGAPGPRVVDAEIERKCNAYVPCRFCEPEPESAVPIGCS